MPELNRWAEIKKTRKDHNCFGCRSVIPAGSKAHYYAGVFEGEFSANHYCEPCFDFLDKHPDYFEEGIFCGEVAYAREHEEGI
jgi:hypothetical protein